MHGKSMSLEMYSRYEDKNLRSIPIFKMYAESQESKDNSALLLNCVDADVDLDVDVDVGRAERERERYQERERERKGGTEREREEGRDRERGTERGLGRAPRFHPPRFTSLRRRRSGYNHQHSASQKGCGDGWIV